MTIEKTYIGSTYIMGVSPLWYDDSVALYKDPALIAQYANSPTLNRLIQDMWAYINPQADFEKFINYVWDINTAQGFGLDILGRIVNVSRQLSIPQALVNLGFNEGAEYMPFGQAPFYSGHAASSTYLLSDEAYRTLILLKALLNISDCSAPSINQLLKNLFQNRGRCYVADTGAMQMRLVFEFPLLPSELAILTQSNVVPRPAAVQAYIMQLVQVNTFGFAEAKDFQPFGQGVFYNAAATLTPAN